MPADRITASPGLAGLNMPWMTSRKHTVCSTDAKTSGSWKAEPGSCNIAKCTTWATEWRRHTTVKPVPPTNRTRSCLREVSPLLSCDALTCACIEPWHEGSKRILSKHYRDSSVISMKYRICPIRPSQSIHMSQRRCRSLQVSSEHNRIQRVTRAQHMLNFELSVCDMMETHLVAPAPH